jgi:DNA-binding transcriptional LysR family regulator
MVDHLMPVCSPKYLAKHEFLRKPKDLARCTLLHDAHAWDGMSEDAEWRHWLREVGTDEVDSATGRFFTLADMSLQAALAHQGVAMGRSTLVKELLETGQLIAPFKQEIESPMKVRLAYPAELADRPGMRAVIRWLHEQAASV